MSVLDQSTTALAADPLEDGVAVVGMAGRFPGADDIAQLWDNLKAGRDTVSRFAEQELEDAFSDAVRRDPNFVRARSILENVELFDPQFFGMQTREAALTDPQQRLLLETAWQALEDAACDPDRFGAPIGMFSGTSINTYFMKHVLSDRRAVEEYTSNHQVGDYTKLLGALADFSATRVAYKLGLTGPAIAVASACSTSLLAIAEACQSLQLLQCDMALAGGCSLTFPQKRGYLFTEGGIASEDGVCRPYDAGAVGTVFGHGCGVVALKRLDDAIADGDRIYAVIGGYGVSNDGKDKVGFAAPSVSGQVSAMAQAYAMAGFDPRTIGYIEGHGTATPLGDPLEFEALKQAFAESDAPDATGFCTIGSGKANYGHLDAAAGVAGFIKAALAVQHGEIPPLAHFEKPNPNIDLDHSPFRINKELEKWEKGPAPRRAAINSLGVGGTNVHIAIEEPPVQDPTEQTESLRTLVISARSKDALAAAAAQLAAKLETPDAPALADVAFTLQEGRKPFEHRAVVAAATTEEAAKQLRALRPTGATARTAPKCAFMFPGQGAQHAGMGKALYHSDPVFKFWVDMGLEALTPLVDVDLGELLFGDEAADDDAPKPLNATSLAQPALYVIEHALAQYWIHRGVEPDLMIGHSVGEYVAATLAGVFSFEDGLKLIAARGRLMQACAPGAMLSVRLSEEELRPLLPEGAEIAAINAPSLVVAAGPFEAIEALEDALTAKDVTHRRLHTSHAFHTAMMQEAVEALEAEAAKITLSAPTKPFISCVSGDWITNADATSPAYWGRHLREAVRFSDGLQSLLAGAGDAKRGVVLLEVGPGRALSTFAGQLQAKDEAAKAAIAGRVETLPDFAHLDQAEAILATAAGGLWAAGYEIDWSQFDDGAGRAVSLPTYPFERKRCWIDAPAFDRNAPMGAVETAPAASTASTDASAAVAAAPAAALQQIAAMTAQLSAGAPHAPTAPAAAPAPEASQNQSDADVMEMGDRKPLLIKEIVSMLEDLSGDDLAGVEPDASFLELGFDSLLLGQVAQKLKRSMGVNVTFRQILSDYPSIDALAAHCDATVPAEKFAAPAPAPVAAPSGQAPAAQAPIAPIAIAPIAGAPATGQPGGIDALIRDQLAMVQQVIAQQLAAYGGAAAAPTQAVAASAQTAPVAAPAPEGYDDLPQSGGGASASRFNVYKSGAASAGVQEKQKAYIAQLTTALNAKLPSSKAYVQKHRAKLADPRTAAGFRQDWKDLVYPIVSNNAKGSRIWDTDGNEYIDLVNGYGQTAFGHSPDFVVDAIQKQLQEGFPIGPQSPLAGETADLISEMTGNERVTFCNTGSEAVMAAMRVARAATGREKIAVFGGAYHGQFDEVLVKPGKKKALPIAPGIPGSSVSNMIVLPYGDPASLEWVRKHQDELAAVVVETVQSRHPDLRPKEFVQELRATTEHSGAALVFDEVVTGFRVHVGGMQAYFGIRADMATYGKVLGGGMPVGVLAGKKEWMDVLDGGHWSYGDDSVPEVAPTFFAGTFVRHPLVLAAVRAVLLHLKDNGQALLDTLSSRSDAFVKRLNTELARRDIASRAESFSSFFYFYPASEDPMASLFYPQMRLLGVNMQEGFPCYLTTAHSDQDYDQVVNAFGETLDRLQEVEILAGKALADAPSPNRAVSASAEPRTPSPSDAPGADLPATVPLTEPMMEIYVSSQFSDEANCAFNEGLTIALEGAIDLAALRTALNKVVARHEGLRASFNIDDETMRVAPELKLALPLLDLSGKPDPQAAFDALIKQEAETPFDLDDGPLFRAQLLKLSASKHALVLFGHHIILDGWSAGVCVYELAEFYREATLGQTPELDPVYPLREYCLAAHKVDEEAEKFWREMYSDLPETPKLPTDRPRPAHRDYAGATYSDFIDADSYKAAKKAGAKLGATPYVFYFAATQVMTARLCDTPDTPVYLAMAGQTLCPDRALVGHAVAALPLRTPFEWTEKFSDHVSKVRTAFFEANDNQNYTLGTLVRRLNPPRDPSRAPISDICFNLERVGGALDFGGPTADLIPAPRSYVHFDWSINLMEDKGGLRIDIDYNTALFDEATIKRWVSHLRAVVAGAVAQPETEIGKLPMHDDGLLNDLLALGDGEKMAVDTSQGLHQMIAARAAETPDREAVRCGDESLTYGALDQAANRLARHMLSALPDEGGLIGVCLPRSAEFIVAILAALKAGCAYAPMDPEHPRARRATALQVASAAALICADDESAASAEKGERVFRLDREKEFIDRMDPTAPQSASAPVGDRPAYVIFTSGSTGAPKGVSVPHHAVVNLLAEAEHYPGLRPGGTVISISSFIFDTSITDIYLPLTRGCRIVMADKDTARDGFSLAELLEEIEPDYMDCPPSIWRLLKEAGWTPNKNLHAGCGGEPLSRSLADWILASGCRLWNLYGPTEATGWCTRAEITRASGDITIGSPVLNTRVRLVDERGELAPIGVPGELLVAGDCLAHGYVGRQDLTDAAFVELSLGGRPPERWYRTKDIGRLNANGDITLAGRRDHQIKLRGYRIELEEIEKVIEGAPGVKAVATALEGDTPETQQIVAYYVLEPGASATPKSLATSAGARLPSYMTPTEWIELQALPLLSNGKLDRKGLAAAPRANTATATATATIKTAARETAETKHDGPMPQLSDFLGGARRRATR
ncbi:MAG: amino acid adenylation domain-containing protein [Neomegalonema sp.]|nr:amino acid adenylation domain-containing protein [Neomegalonema sp.]